MRWMFLDTSYLAYRAFYTTGGLSYQGSATGVIYGIIREITQLQRNFDTPHFAFCFDVGVSKRQDIYPEYKANRYKPNRTEEECEALLELRLQITKLRREYLPELGHKNIFWQKGYEADDIIASLVLSSLDDEDEAIIVSGDQDLYQLLQPNVFIYNPHKKKVVSLKSFQGAYGVTPQQWPYVKALAGCTSDNIKGVHGVGEKTAIKCVRKLLPKTSKLHQVIKDNKAVWMNNIKLTELPLPGTDKFKLVDDSDTILDSSFKGWDEVMKKLGIKSIRRHLA